MLNICWPWLKRYFIPNCKKKKNPKQFHNVFQLRTFSLFSFIFSYNLQHRVHYSLLLSYKNTGTSTLDIDNINVMIMLRQSFKSICQKVYSTYLIMRQNKQLANQLTNQPSTPPSNQQPTNHAASIHPPIQLTNQSTL